MTIPRGIRNSNPGNLRKSHDVWQGETAVQSDPDFVTFQAPEWGLRAMAKVLLNYQRAGLDTVRKIIGRWAPTNENDTDAYVASVAMYVGVNEDARLDLTHPDLLVKLMKAIVRHENGQQPYTDEQFTQALRLVNA